MAVVETEPPTKSPEEILAHEAISHTEVSHAQRYFSNNAPSWETLNQIAQQIGARLEDPTLIQENYLEVGPPSVKARKRTFGKSEAIRVKLYRDHAAWCPYCQMVLIQLEEKKIPYTVETTPMNLYGDKDESFYKIAPSGLVPVIEIDGEVVSESKVIMDRIEKEFPEKPLKPQDGTSVHARSDALLEMHNKLTEVWMVYVRSPPSAVEEETKFDEDLQKFEDMVSSIEGPFLLGKQLSFPDIKCIPFMERMAANLLFIKGRRLRGEGRYPGLERWYRALESNPSYLFTRADYFQHSFSYPSFFKYSGVSLEAELAAKKICGRAEGTWHLPLTPLSDTSFEPYSPGDNPELDTYNAAKKLISNHEAIVLFALRACGKKGERSVPTCALADPTAEPGIHALTQTDAALRHVVHTLLLGSEAKQMSHDTSLLVAEEQSSDASLSARDVISCLRYLRDRVGVPRDMSLPEARQLRAHLNWVADQLV